MKWLRVIKAETERDIRSPYQVRKDATTNRGTVPNQTVGREGLLDAADDLGHLHHDLQRSKSQDSLTSQKRVVYPGNAPPSPPSRAA